MGKACGMYGKEMYAGFLWGYMKEKQSHEWPKRTREDNIRK
jgi:hypothetical protein